MAKYPRYDSTRNLPAGSQKMCSATDCYERATKFIFMQFTYMRGEDEGVNTCDNHAANCIRDPKGFCKQFPTEAWK